MIRPPFDPKWETNTDPDHYNRLLRSGTVDVVDEEGGSTWQTVYWAEYHYRVEFQVVSDDYSGPCRIAHGSVKWDGCVNWSTDQNYMLHVCDPDDAGAVVSRWFKALRPVYTAQPNWDGDR